MDALKRGNAGEMYKRMIENFRVEVGEEAEAGPPGGSRDLLSLWGGHTKGDTSAHLH